MQIMFQATTSTTVAYGATLTTAGVQVLPAWAPPIEYIGTTTPWLVTFMGVTTITGDIIGGGKYNRTEHVRSYGRWSHLHSGAEVIGVRSRVECPANKQPMIVLTYRAVGETTRP